MGLRSVTRAFLPALLLAAGCSPPAPVLDEAEGKTESAERIDAQNDPARFQLTMNRRFAELPTSGESLRKPFPSNWWPMRQGGIGRQWLPGSASPTEKWDLLVHADRIRDVSLTLAQRNARGEPANEGAQPETFRYGPTTEWEHRNHGRHGDRDPDTWWGHCNGWASYVLNEDEPTRPVNVRLENNRVVECAPSQEGCVRFELGDVNALGAEIYWNDAARMLGRRCEQQVSEFTFDEAGRINAVECRDGNAGSFHIVNANMLGLLRRPYIVDLNADAEVWNYPVYRFEVTRNEEISVAEALRAIGAPAGTEGWIYNRDAVRLVRIGVTADIVEDAIPPSTEPAGHLLERYTTRERYEYILELDARGDIIGGEWIGESKTKHPDFLWYSYSNSPYLQQDDDLWDGDNPHIRYSHFKQLLTLAQSPEPERADLLRVRRTPELAIPDNDARGVSDVIRVEESFAATSVAVAVEIRHTYRGDLRVILERSGAQHVLHDRAGGSADDVVGTFQLPALVGADVRGDWTLRVIDTARDDVGRLVSWRLELGRPEIVPPPPPPVSGPLVLRAEPALAIPDADPNGVRSELRVEESFAAAGVTVEVEIRHTYRGDLVVTLERGDRRVVLQSRTGGNARDLVATFEVPTLAGLDVAGAWTLHVADVARADVGRLERWSLTLARPSAETPPPTSVRREWTAQPNLAIPDANPTGVRGTLAVGEDLRIEDLRVRVEIRHTYIGDLRVTLSNGEATQVLHDRQGGSARDLVRTFDTLAFRNGSTRGTWTLHVVDTARQDVGTLVSFGLEVLGRPVE